ncbi:hypothetical protein [Vallitalea okinawensis]|uniref:hypothetical protein n=1 Tax=Vallitalea okinawensis TaxID=2078660 RepID=UPI000CFD9C9A|nr:hypothetical protein [Vallitalea okinawensis]
MLEKMNVKNIVYSVYLGLFIGASIQFYFGQHRNIGLFLVVLIISGIIGLLIGGITEFFTALLPISIATTNKYYLFNNIIALMVTLIVFASISRFIDLSKHPKNNIYMMLFICCTISICNLLVYTNHKRINKRLEKYKN